VPSCRTPQSIAELVNEFAKLPGIRKKTAERVDVSYSAHPSQGGLALADAIETSKTTSVLSQGYNLAEEELCDLLATRAGSKTSLRGRQPRDLMAEQSGVYRGLSC
jgi:recombinational DNA repair protein RecR